MAERTKQRNYADKFLKSLIRSRATEVDRAIIDRMEEIAKKRYMGMAMVAMAWILKRPGVNPTVGLSIKERIDQAVEAVKFELTDEEAKYLEEPHLPKPAMGISLMRFG